MVDDTGDFVDSAPGNVRADDVLPNGNLDGVDGEVFLAALLMPVIRRRT